MSVTGTQRPVAGGERFAKAVERVGSLPATAVIRTRVLGLTERGPGSEQELVGAIESDASIALAVLRWASNGSGGGGPVGSVEEAVARISPEGVRGAVGQLGAYDPLEGTGAPVALDAFRRHGVAVRHASELVAVAAGVGQRAEVAAAGLLHDVGKLVMAIVHGSTEDPRSATPQERARLERERRGADHAVVGGVLGRRWRLAASVTQAIERHHEPADSVLGLVIGLGDAIVRQSQGDPVDVRRMREDAERLGIPGRELAEILAEFPHHDLPPRPASGCPLSARELDALRGLGEGKVYKQIAVDLGVSVSTIRTHLHNVYGKLGAPDRAQAVLVARERGWI